MIGFHRGRALDADRIPVAPTLPVIVGGRYVWPRARQVGNDRIPAGAPFFTEGDCVTCSRCGRGNATHAPFCVQCRALLPMGKQTPGFVPA